MRLKNKINKSETLKDLKAEAEKKYESTWGAELCVRYFMDGVEAALKKAKKPKPLQLDLTN